MKTQLSNLDKNDEFDRSLLTSRAPGLALNTSIFTELFMQFDIIDILNKERFHGRITEQFRRKMNFEINKYDKKTISNELGISLQTLYRILDIKFYWINIETLFSLCRILKIDTSYIKNNIFMFKTKNSFPISTKSIVLDKHFARTVGHVLGDGGIHIIENEGKYRIFYANTQDILLDCFYEDVTSIFPDAHLYSRKRVDRASEIWLPTTVRSIVYSVFDMKDCKLRRVPKFVYNWDEHYIGAFLQALFDDEGYIYPQKNTIAISLSNRELLNDIKILLEMHGIISNPIKSTNSKTRSRMFYFYITGRKNIKNFNSFVGFLHPTKADKL